jgi:hypothetical protein
VLTVEEYLNSNSNKSKFIILRHDVDLKPERSLIAAEIENEFEIRSTYYIRMTDEVFQPEIIKGIAELGHEIGYHYEVLDKAKGDFAKAIEIFKRELNELRKLCEIKTICMHGNSRTKWDNKDLWKLYDFRELGMLGEAYLSVDLENIVYFSDTARTWSPRYKVKDLARNPENPIINSTDDLIELIKSEEFHQIYILMHPDDWCDDFGKWLTNLVTRKFKNVAKYTLGWYWRNFSNNKNG